MKISQLYLKTAIPFLFLLVFTACTNESEKEEQSKIDQFTDRTAEKVVNYIKTPLDKAQDVANKANQRNDAIKKTGLRADLPTKAEEQAE